MPDIERLIRKWEPILDALKIEDPKIRRFVSEYAEGHDVSPGFPTFELNVKKEIKNKHVDIDPYGEENWEDEEKNYDIKDPSGDLAQNLLPVALKILSKLNLKDKNLYLVEEKDVETFKINCKINRGEIIAFAESRMDIIVRLENILINEMIQMLNDRLENSKNLYAYKMADNLSLTTEQTTSPILTLTTKCKIN